MAEKAEETYGTYCTKLSTIKHSAVANWAGYGYQGQCAMLHAVKLLHDNRDAVRGWYLSLESYEDFAIMDEHENIVSLHQCKCFSNAVDFTDECHKISDKREYYHKVLAKCKANVPCYFHSNITPTQALVCDVKAYEFKAGQTTCAADNVVNMIEEVLSLYMARYVVPRNEKAKANFLANMIQNKVAEIHSQKNAENFWAIATSKDSWIPFSQIIAVIEEPDDAIKSEHLRAITSRIAINTHITKCLSEETEDADYKAKEAIVNRFLHKLNSLDNDSLVTVVRRLHPHLEWNETCVTELKASDKGNNLYALLTSVAEINNYENLSWNVDGILSTPSTLGKDRKPEQRAVHIRKNSAALALLRDYRWIVGNIEHSVDNIIPIAPSVTDSDEAEHYERITQPTKLGLLSITDKNDPEYEKNHS